MSRYPNKSMTKTYSLLLNQLQPESFLLEPEVKMTRICQYGLINYHFKKTKTNHGRNNKTEKSPNKGLTLGRQRFGE